MSIRCITDDCMDALPKLADNSVDSIVTDPPYEIGFMGKSWDKSGIAYNVDMWKECLRVLKPGGHLVSFGGTRTYHRLVVAIEDAGFEIRDQLQWIYGSGFPKSMDVSKAIDAKNIFGKSNSRNLRHVEQSGNGQSYTLTGRNNGIMGEPRVYERKVFTPSTNLAVEWRGWGTAVKPAHEPIVLARKPLSGTIAETVIEWGTGGLNIDACRIGVEEDSMRRWPSNVLFDEDAAQLLDEQNNVSRFFYVAKASRNERDTGLEHLQLKRDADRIKDDGAGGDNPRNRTNIARLNYHPTVKPIALMQYLIRLITPNNGTILDPFMGSGTTGCAAVLLQNCSYAFIGIESNSEYMEIAETRIQYYAEQGIQKEMEL